MIKKISEIKFINIIFILILIFLGLLQAKADSLESKIILKINNSIITSTDIKNEANYLRTLNPNLTNLDEKKIFQIAKNSLIREKIKEFETSKLENKTISQEYLENIIKSIYINIGLSTEAEFLNYIKNSNINITDIKKKLSNEALWNRLIYRKFYSKLKIDKNKIREEIKKNKYTYNSYLLYEILFNAQENEKIIELYKNIKKSIDENGFENTASIFSISNSSNTGGKLGWISENSVSKKILDQISILNKGEYTNPITIPGGFLILKVQDIKKIEKKIDVETELSERVRAMQNEQLNQYSNIYFNKIKKEIIIDEK